MKQLIERDGWTLVHEGTMLPACTGDSVTSFRGERAELRGGHPPRHAASTGRVWVFEDGDRERGADYAREYFPSVFGLEWAKVPALARLGWVGAYEGKGPN